VTGPLDLSHFMAPKTRLVYLAGYQIARDDFEVFIKAIRKSLGANTIPEQDASFCFLAYDSLQLTIIPQLPNAHCLSLILSSVRPLHLMLHRYIWIQIPGSQSK